MDHSGGPGDAAERALAREMSLVDSTVEMVAGGHTARMQLGGLTCGDALLDYARRTAAARGVHLTPLWGIGEEGLAFRFESQAAASPEDPVEGTVAAREQRDA
jgi:hypothetical protein